jgi:non-ribosomal peptide synthetase component E (peptide arylation enzyme)
VDKVSPWIVTRARGVRKRFVTPGTRLGYTSRLTSAESLSERIDALAAALREAGVAPDRVASILGLAATASMHALVLEAIADGGAPVTAAPTCIQQLRMAA